MQEIFTALAAFVAAAALVTITPGLDTVLVLRTAAAEGPRRAGLSALGVIFGCLIWALVVAVGLGTLLAASQLAYTILKWAGAAYLVWLGVKMLRHPRSALVAPDKDEARGGGVLRWGLCSTFNHSQGRRLLRLSSRRSSTLTAASRRSASSWSCCWGRHPRRPGLGSGSPAWIVATRPIASFTTRVSVAKTLDRLTGGVFVAFGVGLALEARRV